MTLHDCYAGLHVTNDCDVLSRDEKVNKGLFATGEVTGGSSMHGLSRGLIQSFVLGRKLAQLK